MNNFVTGKAGLFEEFITDLAFHLLLPSHPLRDRSCHLLLDDFGWWSWLRHDVCGICRKVSWSLAVVDGTVVTVEIELFPKEVIAQFASEAAHDCRISCTRLVVWMEHSRRRLAGFLGDSSHLLLCLLQHHFGALHLAGVVHRAGLSEALGGVLPQFLVVVSESFSVDREFIFRTTQQDVVENFVCFGDLLAQMDHTGALENLVPDVLFSDLVKQRQTISVLLLFVAFINFIVKLWFLVRDFHLLARGSSEVLDFHVLMCAYLQTVYVIAKIDNFADFVTCCDSSIVRANVVS